VRVWTWQEMSDKIEADLDLQGEELCSPAEMLGYANSGIDEAIATIHNLNEDYFFTLDLITLVPGTSSYGMPADCYASKIRGLHFNDGSTKYEITRIKRLDRIAFIQPQDRYEWLPTNKLNDGVITDYGPMVTIFPASRDAGAFVTRFYIRDGKRLVALTDQCDVPEFAEFVMNFCKVQATVKEGHPKLDFFISELQRSRDLMVTTLTEMVPDGDNDIEMDMTHYEEHR